MEIRIIKNVAIEILKNISNRPFFCLPLSALLYATLKDNFNVESKLVTGDLLYRDLYIFKQDYKIADAENAVAQSWSGHAWVEIEDTICDLSFFRTLYSADFTKSFKNELIDYFGRGRGFQIINANDAQNMILTYNAIDYLSDEMATSIIQGFSQLLEIN